MNQKHKKPAESNKTIIKFYIRCCLLKEKKNSLKHPYFTQFLMMSLCDKHNDDENRFIIAKDTSESRIPD